MTIQTGPGARAALRTATGGIHEQLHDAPPFLALAQKRLSREEYGTLLSKMAGYYFAVSRQLPIERTRLQRLERDLAAIDAPAPPPLRISIAGEAQRLGWRYVVEGSIFGGRVIYRQLDYLFGDEEAGRSFFRGTSAGTGQWQALCAQLEHAGAAPAAVEQMIEGALGAFALFQSTIAAHEVAHA